MQRFWKIIFGKIVNIFKRTPQYSIPLAIPEHDSPDRVKEISMNTIKKGDFIDLDHFLFNSNMIVAETRVKAMIR